MLTIYCDGGARDNPGPAASAFLVFDRSGKLLEKCGKYLGIATNNVAEYRAVTAAFDYLLAKLPELGEDRVEFRLDSQLVVNQLNGLWKIRDGNLRLLLLAIREKEESLRRLVPALNLTFRYIPREENSRADRLVNDTLDTTPALV